MISPEAVPETSTVGGAARLRALGPEIGHERRHQQQQGLAHGDHIGDDFALVEGFDHPDQGQDHHAHAADQPIPDSGKMPLRSRVHLQCVLSDGIRPSWPPAARPGCRSAGRSG